MKDLKPSMMGPLRDDRCNSFDSHCWSNIRINHGKCGQTTEGWAGAEMSHYLDFKTSISDPKALVRALCRCTNRIGRSWTETDIELREQADHLYGFQNDVRPETANVIIRRRLVGGASNDVGFVRDAEGNYNAIVSEYDQGFYNAQWREKLYTYYNVEKSKMELEAKGIMYEEQKDDKGRIQIKATFKTETNNPGKIAIHL